MIKVYKHETVTSVAEVDSDNAEQALKFARVADGMQSGPEFTEVERRNARYSLEPSTTREPTKVDFKDNGGDDEEGEPPAEQPKSRLPFKKNQRS